MKTTATFIASFMILLPSLWLILPQAAGAQETNSSTFQPKGAYLKITEDFYRALQNEGKNQDRVYGEGQGQSDEYLRRIEVSTRFMVETNLRILQQQQRIIRLLQRSLDRKNGKRR